MRVALRVAIDVAIISQGATGVTVAVAMAALASAEHPIPRYEKRQSKASHVDLVLSSHSFEYKLKSYELNNVQDVMIATFEDNYQAVRDKMIQRIAVKVVATTIAQKAAEATARKMNAGGGLATLIGVATGAAVGVATLSQEKPDLRCWHTLPASLQADFSILPPGEYTAEYTFYNQSDVAYKNNKLEGFILKPGDKKIFHLRVID